MGEWIVNMKGTDMEVQSGSSKFESGSAKFSSYCKLHIT